MSLSRQMVTIHAKPNSGKMQTMIIPTLSYPTSSILMKPMRKKMKINTVRKIRKHLPFFFVNEIFMNGVRIVWRG